MNQFDKQRIENAVWTLKRYRVELCEATREIIVNGTYISPSDIFYVLESAMSELEFEEEPK